MFSVARKYTLYHERRNYNGFLEHENGRDLQAVYLSLRLLHSKNINIPTFGIKVQSTKVPLVLNMLNNRILFEFGS